MARRACVRLFAVTVVSFAAAATAWGQTSSFRVVPSATSYPKVVQAHDISGDGSTVVGFHWSDDHADYWPFRWSAKTGLKNLTPEPVARPALRISRDGSTIAGDYTNGGYGVPQTIFRWTQAGGLEELPVPDDCRFGPYIAGCSADGRIVLAAYNSSDLVDTVVVRWVGRAMETYLIAGQTAFFQDCSDDGRTLVGSSRRSEPDDERDRAVRWTVDGGLETVYQGTSDTYANGCSADGRIVVGGAFDVSHAWQGHAFRWIEGKGATLLEVPVGFHQGDAYDAAAYDCSADGRVIVGRIGGEAPLDANGAYVWIDGKPKPLTQLLKASGAKTGAFYPGEIFACSSDGRTLAGRMGPENYFEESELTFHAYIADWNVVGTPTPPAPRENGDLATWFADGAASYAVGAFSEPTGYTTNAYYAYLCDYYADLYGQWAKDVWDSAFDASSAAADYFGLRYNQTLYNYYAMGYSVQDYYATYGTSSIYAYYFAYYAYLYGAEDLSS